MKGLSMFSSVGMAELLLDRTRFEIVVANEILEERSNFYRHSNPAATMINGDITNPKVFKEIIDSSLEKKVDFVIATPPCQGMSLNGKKDPNDPRNQLIEYVIKAIKLLKPKYVLIENVPQVEKAPIELNGKTVTIAEYVKLSLKKSYLVNSRIVDCSEYGVAQKRKRYVALLTMKGLPIWDFPAKDQVIKTVKDAIGELPSLSPFIRGQKFEPADRETGIHALHKVPVHSRSHVKWMTHTPTGKSAFLNKVHYPKKNTGQRISGGSYSYMRMSWDKPAPTVTTNNGVISSFTNVHPGRSLPSGKYSDARVLTIYEVMRISSVPDDWSVPDWASEKLIRSALGEGIPPLIIAKIFANMPAVKEQT